MHARDALLGLAQLLAEATDTLSWPSLSCNPSRVIGKGSALGKAG